MPVLILFGLLLIVLVVVAAVYLLRPPSAPPPVVTPSDALPFLRRLMGRDNEVPPPFEPSADAILRRLGLEEDREPAEDASTPVAEPQPPAAGAAPRVGEPLTRQPLTLEPEPSVLVAHAVAQPGPAVAEPMPEPEPAVAEPQLAVAVPEPEPAVAERMPEPAVAEPMPAVTEPEPAVVVPEPEPAVVVPEPAVAQPAPKPVQPVLQPELSVAEPPSIVTPVVASETAAPVAAAAPSRSRIGSLARRLRRVLAARDEAPPTPTAEPPAVSESSGSAAETLGGDGSVPVPFSPNLRPAIRLILDGDRAALDRVVAELAGTDAMQRAAVRDQLERLLETILERALDAGYINLPASHPFWGLFNPEQRRQLLAALASLGYRFDGLGGWVDDRVPAKRDLATAVAYAGFDPIRIRSWPTPEEALLLLGEAVISGNEYLAEVAPGLDADAVATQLGDAAGSMAGLLTDWDRVRSALLAEG